MKKLLAAILTLCILALPMGAGVAEGEDVYVLMNIPYADFYAGEVEGGASVDAVASSTLMKPRAGALAGGSYHVDPEGSDISGVVFPVRLTRRDMEKLSAMGGAEITDESRVEITVTLRGEESTAVYEGRDALFEAPSYSWYVLPEEPARYKPLTFEGDPVFGGVQGGGAVAVDGSAAFIYDRHADYVIRVTGMDEFLEDTAVSGIVLRADGAEVGLRHLANIWRGVELGFDRDSEVYAALAGKAITQIRYITDAADYTLETNLLVSDDALLPRLNGAYVELFPEFVREEYHDYWLECIQAYGHDAETAEAYYQQLTQACMGRLYGQEAIDAYAANPESMAFDCYFENGLAKLTISGNTISGADAEGNELFRHDYAYVGDEAVVYLGEALPVSLRVYATEDADAGLFAFFAFADDAPGTTQHIEYRYGASREDIANFTEGEYACWVASGILDGYRESMIKDCIKLFVDENVGEQEDAA